MTEIIALFTFAQARELTDQIKYDLEGARTKLVRAKEGNAWATLGFPTWEEYCKQEFQMSRRRSYQILDHAKILTAIEDVCTNVHKPSEGQARPLAKLEPEQQREAWQEAVESSGNEQPTAKEIAAAVEKVTSTDKSERIHYKPANGLQYATMAISSLEMIQSNDTEREAAFSKVESWLVKHK